MAVPKKKVSRKKRDFKRYNINIKLPVITFNKINKKYHLRHHYNYNTKLNNIIINNKYKDNI